MFAVDGARDISAQNFSGNFKNKHLMDMFKSLCKETNQQKFNKQWQKLDELIGKKRAEDASKNRYAQDEAEALCLLPTDTARTRRRSGSAVKIFSEWIENEPKEKWGLLYDTDGARYGIMTTNFAKVYNWVLRGVRGLPLVAIMKFIVRGCTDYFMERFTKNQVFMHDRNRYFGKMITEYMTKKAESVRLHHVRQCGTQELKFGVSSKDRARRGMRRQTRVKECILKFNGTCCCSCMSPKLLHLPCSHVITACADIRHPVDIYMFPITSERRQLPAPGSIRSMGSFWLDGSLRQRILLYIFQTQNHHGFREGAVRHGIFVMIWMSQSSVRGYSAAVHVIRLDTRINVVQTMMLAPVVGSRWRTRGGVNSPF
jgi:hypothetical protein